MVFADSKYVQPNLIGVFDLLDQVAQAFRRTDRKAGVVERRREAIDANLHVCLTRSFHSCTACYNIYTARKFHGLPLALERPPTGGTRSI
jgi:hypothetical protein